MLARKAELSFSPVQAVCIAFEDQVPGGLKSYGVALWWTAMPQTAEGRVLCFLLSLYGFGVFGYVTAVLASFFIGRDADGAGELAGAF